MYIMADGIHKLVKILMREDVSIQIHQYALDVITCVSRTNSMYNYFLPLLIVNILNAFHEQEKPALLLGISVLCQRLKVYVNCIAMANYIQSKTAHY